MYDTWVGPLCVGPLALVIFIVVFVRWFLKSERELRIDQ